RTLTRPFIWEVSKVATVLAGVEATLVLVLLVVNVRRLLALPRLMNRYPFVTYCVFVCCLAALAMTTFGNLAILVRQRSLVMPALLLLVCLPTRREGAESTQGVVRSSPFLLASRSR
ncbi:MAG TPA: hypothetical protein PLV13_02740, partial [Ilumatobacteraceae bacterium]|nr:hypothetical protein [Ilumatobacteraceae bacterium]